MAEPTVIPCSLCGLYVREDDDRTCEREPHSVVIMQPEAKIDVEVIDG